MTVGGRYKWTPPRKAGGTPRVSTRFGLSVESDLMRDGTAEPFSRDQTVRRERGQENTHFSFSADHEQDWQPYPVDPYSIIRDDHAYIFSIYDGWCTKLVYLCLYSKKCQVPGTTSTPRGQPKCPLKIWSNIMKSLSVDRSYTGGLMLCVKFMQARDEHLSQTNIELAYYYHVGALKQIDSTPCCNRHHQRYLW